MNINNWPKYDRPREKILEKGEQVLSNTELLAIILRTGKKGENAIDLSRKILAEFKTFRNLSNANINQMKKFKGIGEAKIAQIKAAIEIGKRLKEEQTLNSRIKINSVDNVVNFLMPRMRDLKKEIFKILYLDSQNQIITIIDIHGTVNKVNPIIREIFHKALEHYAVSLICVHNHPSGKVTPSEEDKIFTKMLYKSGDLMEIPILDHIIIGDNKYYSFSNKGYGLIK